ncbi:MAG TPA: GtrA family protein, partial [Candidatus Dormibacteraeota bacterium]|nr:GtrA family protein [Candidatus Dormibacteraeota bacterium]
MNISAFQSESGAAWASRVRRHSARFPIFLGVGLCGLATTVVLTALLYRHANLPLWLASTIAIQTAIVVTFTLNSLITWRGHGTRSTRQRAVLF